jgi:siderophore synthetase component
MKMPLSEIIDRYTITLIRKERTDFDVEEELSAYKSELDTYDEDLSHFIAELLKYNRLVWDAEARASRDMNLEYHTEEDYVRIGKVSVEIREANKLRNGVKADIVEFSKEGFKETPFNYKKVNYGR